MSMVDKVTQFADQAMEKAGPLAQQAREKAAPYAQQAMEKAGPYAEHALELAVRNLDVAASGVDRVTGGRFSEQIGSVSAVVVDVLDPEKTRRA